MAGSRANWEGMVESVKNKISDVLKSSPKDKANLAADNVGTGSVSNAVELIRKRKHAQEQALKDAGAL